MDVTYPLMVVGTAERHIQVFNLQNPTTPFKVSRASMYKCELSLTFLVVSDSCVTTQVADSSSILFPQRKRVRCRQY